MPSIIRYLIDIGGVSFNNVLNSDDRVPQSYFKSLTGDGDYREVSLEGSRQPVGVDLTGEWTEVGLAYPYSALLDEIPTGKAVKIRTRISEWECHLRSLLPSTEIFRMSDSLFSEWEGAMGASPIRNSESMRRFLEWLQTQDTRYWTRLPTISPQVD